MKQKKGIKNDCWKSTAYQGSTLHFFIDVYASVETESMIILCVELKLPVLQIELLKYPVVVGVDSK
jgi:hypothetical protein